MGSLCENIGLKYTEVSFLIYKVLVLNTNKGLFQFKKVHLFPENQTQENNFLK